ncbi:MAG TPA: hypothetical protein DCE44_15965, partial [Verrucomicrobiales bacterium]|nr:hypothetical protein [Verrucomicrobiales bacterium]
MPLTSEFVTGFYERTRTAQKVIVVDLGFLGDSAHLVPAVWELKRNYPQAQVHTLAATVGAELLEMAPCVDRAWAYPLSKPSPPFWKHLGILRALRREKFDVAFNFSGADRTVYLTALIGARNSLACAAGRHHFYNPWLIPNWVPRPSRELPVFEQRRQVLAAAGLSLESPRFDLGVPDDAKVWAKETVHEGAIHVSPNASSPFKEWPLENWLAFIPQIAAQTGRPLVVTGDGSPRERQRIEALMTASSSFHLRAFPDRLALAKLAAVL